MTNIKIIFFDIDQTLMLTKRTPFGKTQSIPFGVPEALIKLKQKGIKIAIATGKAYINFLPCVMDLIEKVGIDIFVTINGSYVLFKDQVIYSNPIEVQDIKCISEFFVKNKMNYAYVSDNFSYKFVPNKFKTLVRIITGKYIKDSNVYNKIPIYQIRASYTQDKDSFIQLNVLSSNLQAIRWADTGIDIVKKDTSKVFGVKKTLEFFKINSKDAMSFGDGLNDIEMLKEVGLSVCMGNGYDELKEVADYVTSDIEDNGIINALKHFNILN
ncbi:MAG: Cof-type HAD-IIB family hydrolase [Psittacicella sp.]